jgi:hypothetical protein
MFAGALCVRDYVPQVKHQHAARMCSCLHHSCASPTARLTACAQILNALVAVIHCFSFGQGHTVLSRVAEALWGVVLHCALQLPPLSTASFLQLELEVSVLAKFLAGVDSEFTCAAELHTCRTHVARVPSCALLRSLCRLGIKSQVLEALRALCVAPASKEQVRGRTSWRCAELAAAVTLPCSNSSKLARHTACSCHPKSPSSATFCIAARALWNALLRSRETLQYGVFIL